MLLLNPPKVSKPKRNDYRAGMILLSPLIMPKLIMFVCNSVCLRLLKPAVIGVSLIRIAKTAVNKAHAYDEQNKNKIKGMKN